MHKPRIELADVVSRFGAAYEEQLGHAILPSHRRALRDIEGCMTAAMGGGQYHCADCQTSFWSYHGCRNRSCPKCHGRQTAEWLKKREAEMLPCEYFHVVATVPKEIRGLFLRYQKLLYGLLMKTAAESVRDLAAQRKYVGGEVGILAVLHTWTAQLHFHPHVHMLVTGGGVSEDGARWCEAPTGFLVPVKKLSSMIRQRFADALRTTHPDLFAQIPPKCWSREWCSFCKPFGEGREAVLRYLARYAFRIAITGSRIVGMDNTHVTLRYKENATGEWKTTRVEGVEFIRRFLLHVLPKGFHKVRYYGLWHSSRRQQQQRVRLLLSKKDEKPKRIAEIAEESLRQSGAEDHAYTVRCPHCRSEKVTCLSRMRRGDVRMVT